MNDYEIITTVGTIKFKGRIVRELETGNWHYYERDDGVILHFRKNHMVVVIGDNYESILGEKKRTEHDG